MFRLVTVACLVNFLPICAGYSIATSVPVEQPPPMLMDIADVYHQRDVFRLNDRQMGLTAIKDKKYQSCFVNDYDPYWLPASGDKQYIIQNQPCEKVGLNTGFDSLRKKAGPQIADMCRDLFVFWMASQNLLPPTLEEIVHQTKPRCPYYNEEQINAPKEPLGPSERSGNGPGQDRGAAPIFDDNSGDGNRKPPTDDSGAPPLIHNGAPPMIGDGRPPLIGDHAPPMAGNGPPPLISDGAPPLGQNGAPPVLQNIEIPPPLKNQELIPPPTIKTPPPLKLLSALNTRDLSEEKAPHLINIIQRNLDSLQDSFTPTPDMRTPPPPKQLVRNDSG